MKTKDHQRLFPPIVFSIMVGITLGLLYPGATYIVTFMALLALIVLIYSLNKKRFRPVPFFLFIAIGYLLIQPYVDVKHGKDHITSYADGSKYLITGMIQSKPDKKNRRYRFVLKPETIAGADSIARPVIGNMSVSVYGDKLGLKKGDSISFSGRIRCFRNFKNPGAFDYERFMAFKNIWASTYVSANKIKLKKLAAFSPVMMIQHSIIRLISKNVAGEDSKSVLMALIVGEKQSIRPELRAAFNRTGTGHLLAISGLHTGIVAVCSFGFFCLLLSFSSRLLWSGKILSISGLLTLMPVVAYGVLAGMPPSTQRAVIMVSFLLLSYSFNAEYDLVNTLALAALIILIISPVSLFSVSFQLSFSAVCAISAGVMILNVNSEETEFENKLFQQVKVKFKSFLLISFFAWTGTFPIVSYYFNQVSMIGLPANIVLVPIVGFFVVPAGLLSVLASFISETVGGLLINLTGHVLEKALLLVQYLSGLPWASAKVMTPSVSEIICFYSVFFLLLFVVFKIKSGERINRNVLKAVSVMIFFVVVADVSVFLHKRFFHNSFCVTVIDVGQGSAALLEFPNGKTMLIDGGGFNDNRAFDVGEKVVAPFLWKKRIQTIDTVVLTHPESDHLNGLLYILEHFHVETVLSNGQKRQIAGYKKFISSIKRKKIKHLPYKDMKKEFLIGGVSLEILYPFDDFADKYEDGRRRKLNNNSLVIRAEYQGVSFLFPGDIMKRAEGDLVWNAGEKLKSTVLIVPHHGSNTSCSRLFLNAVQPDYAVISAGWKNRFHMPHNVVVKRLNKRAIKIYRTDEQGAVRMRVKHNQLSITAEVN